jgi:hypothetical protein
MQAIADNTDARVAIRTDLGAIFVLRRSAMPPRASAALIAATSAMVTVIRTGRRAPARLSCTFPNCAVTATSRPSWNRAG